MFSYVFTTATSFVKYPPFRSHQVPSSTEPTDLSKVHQTAPAFGPFPSTSTSTSASSSRASSTAWDSSSDSSDTQAPSSRPSAPGLSTPAPSSSRSANRPPDDNENEADRYSVIHEVLRHENLYEVLGTTKTADPQQLRRAYITRSKRCHPDKFPEYRLATLAFQKVSFAYDTLSHPPNRRAYDKAASSPRSSSESSSTDANTNHHHPAPDDTLNAVLFGVFCDFMDGDYEMIRTFLRAMGEINSRMQMGDETIESLLGSLVRLREVLLVGHKYIRIVRFELIRMHEIQSNLRQLSYFDVRGRLRLTLQLARVTLSLPVVVDLAMREEDANDESSGCDSDAEDVQDEPIGGRPRSHPRKRKDRASRGLDNARDGRDRPRVKLGKVTGRRKRGLLPPPVSVVIGLAIGALEIGERVL